MGSKRILVVDDSQFMLHLFSMLLRGVDGYQVDTAMDGLAALEALQGQTFDLVITDYMMPNMDGLALLGALRRTHPEVPVIMISANVTDQLRIQAQGLGVYRVMSKPVPKKAFVQTVKEALGNGTTMKG
jgi:CheY-like chemotaxis protein